MIGGYLGYWDNTTHLANDAWYTEDGVNWTQAAANAPWDARVGHTTAVFNNKLWLIGGYTGTRRNDVWWSENGVDWTQATAGAPWDARANHTAVVSDNRLWVIGGSSSENPLSDVWWSENGVDWTLAADHVPCPREDHSSVVFDNKLWILGGVLGNECWEFEGTGEDICRTVHAKDVWCSEDGVTWTEANALAPWGTRYDHASVAFDGKLWIVGGSIFGYSYSGDVWWSIDGANWIEATGVAPWGARHGHTSVVFDNQIWCIGGAFFDLSLYEDANLCDVWASGDGAAWKTATAHAPWSARAGHTSVVFQEKMWVLGGDDGHSLNDVWRSEDGVNWIQVANGAPWSPRYEHTSVVFQEKMWVLGGNDGHMLNDVWWSDDGVNWIQATDSAQWSPRSDHTVSILDNKLWITGGRDATYNYLNDVWWSADGAEWMPVTDSAPWESRAGHTTAVLDGKLWLIAGGNRFGLPFADVWAYALCGQHNADQDSDAQIDFTELLRVVQFFNAGGYHCANDPNGTEDGYEAGLGASHVCDPHASDYNGGTSWTIDLTELLRLIQFFNIGGYHACAEAATEDGFCAGLP